MLRHCLKQRHRNDRIRRSRVRQTQKFGRKINPADAINGPAVEPQIQARPDADLKNQTSRRLDRPLAAVVQQPVPHREVEQAGQKPAFVNAKHSDLRGHSFWVHDVSDPMAITGLSTGQQYKPLRQLELLLQLGPDLEQTGGMLLVVCDCVDDGTA